jgi:hypothetical protein
LQGDLPRVGVDHAARHAEGGRFASAVGAEQSDDFARLDAEVDAVDDVPLAVGFAQSARFKDWHEVDRPWDERTTRRDLAGIGRYRHARGSPLLQLQSVFLGWTVMECNRLDRIALALPVALNWFVDLNCKKVTSSERKATIAVIGRVSFD